MRDAVYNPLADYLSDPTHYPIRDATMNTPDGYQRAAKQAADRWKKFQSDELRDQIIDTWQMTKVHRADTGNSVRLPALRVIWQDAFKDIGSWKFDFMKDETTF